MQEMYRKQKTVGCNDSAIVEKSESKEMSREWVWVREKEKMKVGWYV